MRDALLTQKLVGIQILSLLCGVLRGCVANNAGAQHHGRAGCTGLYCVWGCLSITISLLEKGVAATHPAAQQRAEIGRKRRLCAHVHKHTVCLYVRARICVQHECAAHGRILIAHPQCLLVQEIILLHSGYCVTGHPKLACRRPVMNEKRIYYRSLCSRLARSLSRALFYVVTFIYYNHTDAAAAAFVSAA